MIPHWFETYFEPLDPRVRLEIINPVQTKVHKYLASRAARQIVGQPASTIDFRQLIAYGRIVIVKLSLFEVGEGSTVGRPSRRASRCPGTRHPVMARPAARRRLETG